MDSHGRGVAIAVLVLACTGSIVARQDKADPAALKNPVAATPESVAAGKTAYQRRCASCHGTNGEGGPGNDLVPAAPNLVDDQWDHGSSDGEIFTNIKNGIPPDLNMVPFRDTLTDTDIWNVVNYLRSMEHRPLYLASGSGRTWNFTSLLVVPFPPSAWNGARVA